MTILASDVLTVARTALLNDPAGAIYPDESMWPVIDKAYRELQNKLSGMGIPTAKEVTVSIVITAGTTSLGAGTGLPTDFLSPIWLGERDVGSTLRFVEMKERSFEPDLAPQTNLLYWSWREDELKFVGATKDRELLIRHWKSLGNVTGSGSIIKINNSKEWIAQRAAAIAALTIGGNPTRASALMVDIQAIWDDFKMLPTHKQQSRPVRRRVSRYRPR